MLRCRSQLSLLPDSLSVNCRADPSAVIHLARIRKRSRNKRKISRRIRPSGYRECCFGTLHSKKKMSSGDWERNPMWFWSNYWRAVEWQSKHQVSLWKSYAFALHRENKYLLRELWKLMPGRVYHTPLSSQNLRIYDELFDKRHKPTAVFRSQREQFEAEMENSSNLSDEDVAFEMSEEMMKFFEQSFRHKLEMKKLKETALEGIVESEIKELQESHYQREKEMKLLYGDGSSMIVGMETAVQLSFDKYCDMKSPKYWPNIPLNL